MLTYTILTTLILIIANFLLIKKSKRKRKYGIYPGRISLGLVAVLGLYYFFVLLTNTTQQAPVLKKDKKTVSLATYQNELNAYMKENNEREKNITKHLKYIHYIYIGVVVQLTLAFVLSLFGLITIKSRRNFYITTSIAYVIGLFVILVGNWYLS